MTTDTVFEFRHYTLLPGRRDDLVDLFEREFIESQEAVGANVVGTFLDLDAPERFAWIRGFSDMAARRRALQSFYDGPVWRAHGQAANATMVDSDDVRLLRLVGSPPRLLTRYPPLGVPKSSTAVYAMQIYPLETVERAADLAGDPRLVAAFATAPWPNDFPRLPVREDPVFAILRRFEARTEPTPPAGWPAADDTIRLQPTARSPLQ